MAGTKEDRHHKRVDVTSHHVFGTLAISIAVNKTMGCLVPIKDFSKSGAGVYSTVKVEKGAFVRLSIDGPGHDVTPLDGKVIWCGSSVFDPGAPPTHPFRVGIEFTPKDDTDREAQIAMYRYLAKLAGQTE
jgi:hypothetical protein